MLLEPGTLQTKVAESPTAEQVPLTDVDESNAAAIPPVAPRKRGRPKGSGRTASASASSCLRPLKPAPRPLPIESPICFISRSPSISLHPLPGRNARSNRRLTVPTPYLSEISGTFPTANSWLKPLSNASADLLGASPLPSSPNTGASFDARPLSPPRAVGQKSKRDLETHDHDSDEGEDEIEDDPDDGEDEIDVLTEDEDDGDDEYINNIDARPSPVKRFKSSPGLPPTRPSNLKKTKGRRRKAKSKGPGRRFTCPHCGESITRRTDLRRHMESSASCPGANKEPRNCQHCPKTFLRLDALNRHNRSVHRAIYGTA